MSPSAAECALYRVSAYTALGTPDDAVPHARRIKLRDLDDTERTGRALTDTARMWHALGEHQRAYSTLLMLERTAAEEVRRPALQNLVSGLLYTPARLPGIRDFAARTGTLR